MSESVPPNRKVLTEALNLSDEILSEEAVALLAEEGFDPEFGARPLRRTIQRRVDNRLSRMLLDGSLEPGSKVLVGAEDARLTFEIAKREAVAGGAT